MATRSARTAWSGTTGLMATLSWTTTALTACTKPAALW